MTIEQLIAKLETFDLNLEVAIQNAENDQWELVIGVNVENVLPIPPPYIKHRNPPKRVPFMSIGV